MNFERKKLTSMYKKMLEIRRFEEKVEELYSIGLIPGLAHSYIGQEAVAVGVCSALKDDYLLSGHRGHGHSIASGVPPKYLLAELFGKKTGVCKGIGGSMHSTYLETGLLFSTAIVGGNIPIATGVGLAISLKKKDKVVACFFGDGATNTGAFHEGINLAALWKLPVIFVCENNLYGISTHASKTISARNIADRALAYDIPSEIIDGNDVIAIYKSTARAVERAKKSKGPTLLECRTYRLRGHGMYDIGYVYRTKDEVEEWQRKDPIQRFMKKIIDDGVITKHELTKIEKEIGIVLDEAVQFAKESEYPTWEWMTKTLYEANNGE
ncbi:MAG: thiamine pyrophosphate-dependent dehydrogenase E1 component subunit alpha [Candidatus Hodarchaeales archaeon]|jgi:TPP-dependent pyruvate/acetoin dehydrogenase alpha subunit